jgi:hypothetical protein
VLVLLVLLAGCRDWREHVDPSKAASEPDQNAITGEPPLEIELKGYQVRLTPRATYKVTGYAAETSRKLLDKWDFVMPLDLALVWGPVADPAVLSHMKFHLSDRYVSYWYDGSTPSAVIGRLPSHVANNHLIPSTDEVADPNPVELSRDLVGRGDEVVVRDVRRQPSDDR